MTKLDQLIVLVNSMSKPEKRIFQMQNPENRAIKDYQLLYRLVQKKAEGISVKDEFLKQRPNASFGIACKHLYDVLIKSLINQNLSANREDELYFGIMQVKLLFRRNLYDPCFKLIEKLKKEALQYEKFSIYLELARLELKFASQIDFQAMTEYELLKKQGNIERISRQLRSIDNHCSLYYLIRHRQVKQGAVKNEADKESLKNLAFNELQAVSGFIRQSFEGQKIHLLFQSAYFMMTGNQKSSMILYNELNELFEQNSHLWDNPPEYYLYHLKGILSNLRLFNRHDEMKFFINRIKSLKTSNPRQQAVFLQPVFLFESIILTDQKRYKEALEHLNGYQLNQHLRMDEFRPIGLAEFCFQSAIVYHGNKQYRQAIKALLPVTNNRRSFQDLPLLNSIRLFKLAVHFDMKDYDFLDYEIRSFKRDVLKNQSAQAFEKLLLGFFSNYPNLMSERKKKIIIDRTKEKLGQLIGERQDFQFFDFRGWLDTIKIK
ncbi:MAG: hypothetical protein GXO81_12590 [Chlorobi bacterium]|nr:hypothetical protein [Chlorobiota bacterium]